MAIPDRAATLGRAGTPGRAAGLTAAGSQASRRQTGLAPGHAEPPRWQQPSRPADDFPEDPGPYDGTPAGPGSGSDSLTGMDLIERELGGKVIEELGG